MLPVDTVELNPPWPPKAVTRTPFSVCRSKLPHGPWKKPYGYPELRGKYGGGLHTAVRVYTRWKITDALVPPKPKEFESTTSI